MSITWGIIQLIERGIFDCDEAYRTPTRPDFESLFQSGLIVLDANVLLNLYRSNERTRRDTFSVLLRLRERIWVPHQVLVEFWRNRGLPSVRGHHRTKAHEVSAALDKASRSVKDALDRWVKDVHLNTNEEVRRQIDGAKSSMSGTLERLKKFIQEQAEEDAVEGTAATHTDPVLKELEGLLQGRIGEPLSDEDLTEALQEAQRRADNGIPPGYADFQTKSPERAAGDYILWKQLLNEAEGRTQDVLLVTGDVKEDWWIRRDGEIPARPRKELELELRQYAGVSLYMLTPSQLLAEADEILGLKVDRRSVSDLATSEVSAFSEIPENFFRALPYLFHLAHKITRKKVEAVPIDAETPRLYASILESVLPSVLSREISHSGGAILPLMGRDYPVVEGYVVIPLRCGRDLAAMRNAHSRVQSSRKVARAIGYYETCKGIEKEPLQSDTEVAAWLQGEIKGIIVAPFASSFEGGITAIQWWNFERRDGGFTDWDVMRGESYNTL